VTLVLEQVALDYLARFDAAQAAYDDAAVASKADRTNRELQMAFEAAASVLDFRGYCLALVISSRVAEGGK
jgi:hypothetical protein